MHKWNTIILMNIFLFLAACASGSEESGALAPATSTPSGEGALSTLTPTPDTATATPTNMATGAVAPVTVESEQTIPQPTAESTPQAVPSPSLPADPVAGLVQETTLDLAGRLEVDSSEVELVTTQDIEWSDSSLGCPEPDGNYLMVITPGYRIILRVGDQEYTYHTDQQGHFVLCQDGRPASGA